MSSSAAPAFDGPRCFCRDCLDDLDFSAKRCARCGSPRLVRHHALPSLSLAHIDCDAFYATVEKRDNPEIADRPVIIGGGKRGVVSAACYIARTYGVRSAMPMFKALALCPHAVVIGPDMAKYVRVGREVRQAMQALTPLVEPLSIDEAFLDLSGTQRVHGMPPAKVLARFARDVESKIGITVSVGLSCNKFLAKIASDLDKPRGFAVLGGGEAAAFLANDGGRKQLRLLSLLRPVIRNPADHRGAAEPLPQIIHRALGVRRAAVEHVAVIGRRART